MNIKEQHIVSGMVTDMNVSRFDATKVQYARNIRITQMEGNKGLLCVTNEKGTKNCTLSSALQGIIVGSCMLNDYLVVFTYDSAYTIPEYTTPFPTIEGPEHIYRLEKGTTYDFNVTELYKGNLDFVKDGTPLALETLSVYETEDIQKVYWVDGVHQLRCINITKTYESPVRESTLLHTDSKFDSNPVIDTSHLIDVEKHNLGGEFPAGEIQYAFTYFNLNGPETNVFDTTPLYELSPKAKGVAADGRVNCSFTISLSLLDSSFEYVRAYAILRSSANATPSVRIVGDYKIDSQQKVTIEDNGMIGSTVDATYLLFVGGEPICPATITVKDNTLFLGNINLTRPAISTLKIGDTDVTIQERVTSMVAANTFPLINTGHTYDGAGSGNWFYDYNIDNNRPSNELRRFKRGETYRLGFIAQHETGIWSDVVWIGDFENTVVPQFYKHKQKAGCFRLYRDLNSTDASARGVTSEETSIDDILTTLHENGFHRIAPVAVYPEGTDRTIFCQGLVSATVYNVEDRYNNRPFSQASWFFRPISEGFGIAAIPHATLYPVRTNAYNQDVTPAGNTRPNTVPTYNDDIMGSAEIQINTNPRVFLPEIKGKWTSEGTRVTLSSSDTVAMFGNDYFIDTSIVTLNSPDIEFDDSLQQEDFDELKLRIVGVAKSSAQNLIYSTYMDISAGLYPEETVLAQDKSRFLRAPLGKWTTSGFPSYPGYAYIDEVENNSNVYHTLRSAIIYPWQKTGRICGNYNVIEDNKDFSILNNKVMSNFWFAHTEMFDNEDIVNVEESTDTYDYHTKIKLFDDTQGDFVPLGETADSSVYYGNIDSVRLFKRDILSSTYTSNLENDFYMMEPELLDSNATFREVIREPNTTNKYPLVVGPSFSFSKKNSDEEFIIQDTLTGSIEDTLETFNADRTVASGNKKFFDDAPVPIRYKSTKHAVISLPHDDSEIPSLYRCEAIILATGEILSPGQDIDVHPFWENSSEPCTYTAGKVPFATEWDDVFSTHRLWLGNKDSYKTTDAEIPTLYIGELYRTVDANVRFGGKSSEAISKNVWVKCGKGICTADLTSSGGRVLQPGDVGYNTTLIGRIGNDGTIIIEHQSGSDDYTIKKSMAFMEGDTYLTRYDCLKTYPYAEKDTNSIVEIFSTDLETRVNLDARYDNARGLLDNTLIRPENINLVNRLGYEQENNFFTYTALDPNRETADKFPNLVAITREKTLGEEVDVWMSNNLLSTQDLEGTYGEIEALRTYNNDVYAFQTNAFGQILFNNRVQIPTGDGQPIEITNGMKLQGIRYLSNKIGCSNKWSIALSNSRMYWYDAGTKDIWAFGGQLENLSTSLGVKGWLSDVNPARWTISDMTPIRTLHDEKYNDLYFIIGNSTKENYGALVYSETLNTFVSVMDYTELEEMHNLHDRVFAVKKNGIHAMWEGNYNSFFGIQKPYILRFIANAQPTMHKVFDTVQWRSDSWNSAGKYIPNATFTRMQVWNQYQKSKVDTTTGDGILTNTPGKPSPLKKKFNTFRALVPRDKMGNSLTDSDYRYKQFSRIRGNYAVVELTHSPVDSSDAYKMQFYDLEIGEFL